MIHDDLFDQILCYECVKDLTISRWRSKKWRLYRSDWLRLKEENQRSHSQIQTLHLWNTINLPRLDTRRTFHSISRIETVKLVISKTTSKRVAIRRLSARRRDADRQYMRTLDIVQFIERISPIHSREMTQQHKEIMMHCDDDKRKSRWGLGICWSECQGDETEMKILTQVLGLKTSAPVVVYWQVKLQKQFDSLTQTSRSSHL